MLTKNSIYNALWNFRCYLIFNVHIVVLYRLRARYIFRVMNWYVEGFENGGKYMACKIWVNFKSNNNRHEDWFWWENW